MKSRTLGNIAVVYYPDEKDMKVNVQNVTCHELVHACSAHPRLPAGTGLYGTWKKNAQVF